LGTHFKYPEFRVFKMCAQTIFKGENNHLLYYFDYQVFLKNAENTPAKNG